MNNFRHLAFLLLFSSSFAIGQGFNSQQWLSQPDSQQTQPSDPFISNIVFKSTDGGKTLENISNGLPKNLKKDGQGNRGIGDEAFANSGGLYVPAGNSLYFNDPNSTGFSWKKEQFPGKMSSIAPGKAGMYAYNYGGQIVQKANGTSGWLPVYTSFQGNVGTIFETAGGTVFIGSDNGLFKSTNSGKTWKHVHAGGWVIKLVEQNGTLLATSMSGIIRSTDDGEHWAVVISEGGVGIDVAAIKDGFAAITFNTQSNNRRVRSSYDGGKTWQLIDAGLPASSSISSIVQVGESLFCGHPFGIYQSSDKGKTWKCIRCSVDGKVYNLSVSGNVLYAIPQSGGC